MDLTKFFVRNSNLLLSPDNEFQAIRAEMPSVINVNKTFVIPFAIIISVFSLIETLINNLNAPINSFIFIALNTVILFLIILTHCYLSGKVISLIGKNLRQNEPPGNYYALSAYSQLPFLITLAIIKLLPSLIFLIILGLYAGVLINKGSRKLTRVPLEKQLQFTLLSVLIIIVIFVITSEVYTMLYSEIVEQFSKFAT